MWTVNRQWCPSVDGRTDRCFDGDLPGQGPRSSQQGVHHWDREVPPLPGVELILLHHFGHRKPLQQPVDHPEKQGAHQHWRAWVTLQHRKQGVHPHLPTPASPLSLDACFLFSKATSLRPFPTCWLFRAPVNVSWARWWTEMHGLW